MPKPKPPHKPPNRLPAWLVGRIAVELYEDFPLPNGLLLVFRGASETQGPYRVYRSPDHDLYVVFEGERRSVRRLTLEELVIAVVTAPAPKGGR
jgi:hypothetical protein